MAVGGEVVGVVMGQEVPVGGDNWQGGHVAAKTQQRRRWLA